MPETLRLIRNGDAERGIPRVYEIDVPEGKNITDLIRYAYDLPKDAPDD
jgi:hypothetical protein